MADPITPIGELDDDELDAIDTDVFEIPFVAHKVTGKKRTEVTYAFRFAGMRAFGVVADFVEIVEGRGGSISLGLAHPFVRDSLVDDEERERFRAFIDDPTLIIQASTIAVCADQLSARYLNRPTLPESGSSPGRSGMNGKSVPPGSVRAGASSARSPRR